MAATLTLPLFPLNTVLFPGGLLPLRIFEQRYLDMTKACIRDGTPFGVCAILEGEEVGPTPALHAQVGCTSLIVEWDMPHLGMFQLQTRGQTRFSVLSTHTAKSGLLEAEVELLDEEPGEADEAQVTLCGSLLTKIIERIGSEWFFPPARYDSAEWVGHRLAEALPLSQDSRQKLLELPGVAKRLEHLHTLIVQSGAPTFST
jgi:Lon protease-like protein